MSYQCNTDLDARAVPGSHYRDLLDLKPPTRHKSSKDFVTYGSLILAALYPFSIYNPLVGCHANMSV